MPTFPRRARREARGSLSERTVATVHVYADLVDADERREYERILNRRAQESFSLITAGLRASVAEHLGPEFEVQVVLQDGSVELVATIVFIGGVVMTYGAVRDGLDAIRADASALMERVLRRPPGPWPEVAAWVTLGPGMSRFALDVSEEPGGVRQQVLYMAVMGSLVTIVLLGLLVTVVLVEIL
jgi:hypothetical protein